MDQQGNNPSNRRLTFEYMNRLIMREDSEQLNVYNCALVSHRYHTIVKVFLKRGGILHGRVTEVQGKQAIVLTEDGPFWNQTHLIPLNEISVIAAR